MIPATNKIEILKAGDHDIWGESMVAETMEINGNLRSQTQVVTDANGKDVVSNYRILFIGFVNVNSKDKIRFTEPNGEKIESKPLQIKFMRDLDGTVAFTRVIL